MKQFVFATSLVCASCLLGCVQSAPTPPPQPATTVNPPNNPQNVTSEPQPEKPVVDPAPDTNSFSNSSNDTAIEKDRPADAGKSRQFTFHYRFQVKDLKPQADADKNRVRVWLPAATSSDEQDVKRLTATAPAEITEHREDQFGNTLLYLETTIPESGAFTVDAPYQVTRREVLRGRKQLGEQIVSLDEPNRSLFLRADKFVPIDGKPLRLLDMVELLTDRMAKARQLYDLVDQHVTYKKEGTGWGRGDSNWVCDSRYGNCTDFHSLFISLARSQGLPARFEIGFSIPTDKSSGPIAGYHCWAWFHAEDHGWVPVDISEADKNPMLKDYYFGGLTPDRVTFSVGRDLELVPKAATPPLNFFIYPHIEVDGQVLPKENVSLQFQFTETD